MLVVQGRVVDYESHRGHVAVSGEPRSDRVVYQGYGARTVFNLGSTVAAGLGFWSLVAVVLAMMIGYTPQVLIDPFGLSEPTNVLGESAQDQQAVRQVERLLGLTDSFWEESFRGMELSYERPTLHFYEDVSYSACGVADNNITGPYYCASKKQIFLSRWFERTLRRKYSATESLSLGYVIAHEVGHHVQHALGLPVSHERGVNGGSVRTELQADCLAGMWVKYAQSRGYYLESKSIDSALSTAAAVGDDMQQRQFYGSVVAQEHFTHGTADQRVRWVKKGISAKGLSDCDTWSPKEP